MTKFATIALTLIAAAAQAQTITIDRNEGAAATPAFSFARVATPAKDDAASKAEVTLLAGRIDTESADLRALVDGNTPENEDQPGRAFFMGSNSWGGRVRLDLGAPMQISEIRSYSWHRSERAPQVYKVWGSDGIAANFDIAPSNKLDPADVGWTLIAFVDTRIQEKHAGGQYAVSIAGNLGRHRYLVFDFFETESQDPWGNTFYGEIDVIAARAGATSPSSAFGTFSPHAGRRAFERATRALIASNARRERP